MILTYNYNDLQNIKKQMQMKNIKSDEKIYYSIKVVKDTLEFIFENNLTNKSKKDIEKELLEFKNELLKHTDLSYKQLESQYKYKYINIEDYYINSNVANL